MGSTEPEPTQGAPGAAPDDLLDICRAELVKWDGTNEQLIAEVHAWMICRLGPGDHGHTHCWVGTLVIGALAGPAVPERSIWDDVV